jgi:hypothetical protein
MALRKLSGGTAMLPALWRFMGWPAPDAALQPVGGSHGKHGGWTTETIGEGSHI